VKATSASTLNGRHQHRRCETCLCENDAVFEILRGAIECELDRIASDARCEDWKTAHQSARDLTDILQAIVNFEAKQARNRSKR
jgi:hypothetical protein